MGGDDSEDGIKEIERYFCPFCGNDYENNLWTTEHIIPAAIGGPKRFTIKSCRTCNNRIGKEIEQPVLRSEAFKTALGNLIISGERIRRRRGKRYITLNNTGLLYKGTYAKFHYDTEEHERILSIFSRPDGLTAEQLLQRKEFTMLYPDSDLDRSKQLEIRLIDKILLGCGHWLWGERFSRSPYSVRLREHLLNGIEDDEILDLPSEEKHLVIKDEDKGESGKEVDALDNSPHTTISIFEADDHLWGLVNLLGGYESLATLGKLDPSIDLGIKRGVVVIAKSTKNEVIKMSWDEYEHYKEGQKTKRK